MYFNEYLLSPSFAPNVHGYGTCRNFPFKFSIKLHLLFYCSFFYKTMICGMGYTLLMGPVFLFPPVKIVRDDNFVFLNMVCRFHWNCPKVQTMFVC